MRSLHAFYHDVRGAAAAEMALIVPVLVALMFASMELGNYFVVQHAVAKHVRDGARYASRMTLAEDYECPGTVFADSDFDTTVENVTRTGSVDGSAAGRFPATFWAGCGADQPVTVSLRCVPKTGYAGIYSGLDGDIPVVKVSAAVNYASLFSTFGFNTANFCMRAESETAVAGI